MKIYKIFTMILCLFNSTVAEEMKLVSYNIRHGVNMKGKMDLVATADFLKGLSPDVVALQEVDKKCGRSGKVDQAKFLGEKLGMHHAFAKFMDYDGGEYGLALLSKYPILEAKTHLLPKGAEPRVALEIEVEPVKGKKISYICVHFDFTSEKLRMPQVQALLKAISEVKHPVVLVGDFNAKPESDSIKTLSKDWYNVPKKGNKLTFPSNKPRIEIDYVMFRGELKKNGFIQVVDEKIVSDHRPLVTELEFK